MSRRHNNTDEELYEAVAKRFSIPVRVLKDLLKYKKQLQTCNDCGARLPAEELNEWFYEDQLSLGRAEVRAYLCVDCAHMWASRYYEVSIAEQTLFQKRLTQ